MSFEICVDDSGWKWIMPKLDANTIDEVGLGTFDLANWTYGTRESFEHATWNDNYKLPFYAKPFWVLENMLRCIDWYIFLRHKKWFKVISKLRDMVFNIAWKISERGYQEVDAE